MMSPAATILRRVAAGIIVVMTIVSMLVVDVASAAVTPTDKFVRTANQYLKAGTAITAADYPALAKYDLVVFPAEAQNFNRGMFAELRRLNSDIVILAYVPTKSFNDEYWTDDLHRKLLRRIEDSFWLTDSGGVTLSVWPGTRTINAVTPWQSILPTYVKEDVMSSGVWDGIFYDEFSTTISWLNGGDIDLQRDGVRDDARLADVAWKRSMITMLKRTRELLGPAAVIITNGDSDPDVQPFVNGRMFESFPTPWEGRGTWTDSMRSYLRVQSQVGFTPVSVVNSNTRDTGDRSDYRRMRFGLASTLMGDGYFSFDFGETDHGQLWSYDEQDARLGRPLGGPVNVLAPQIKDMRAGVWRRDFERGVALVNSTKETRTVVLGQDLERLHGTQDALVNNGAISDSVVLGPEDGIILMKTVARLRGTAFPNGAFARVFDARGVRTRNGFFAYESPIDGAAKVLIADLDGDGVEERVVGGRSAVTVYKEGRLTATFEPYGSKYAFGVEVAVGDFDGDGRAEIVTGTGAGAGPQVRVWSMDGRPLGPGFMAFDPGFRGGVRVAVGDIYGTGRPVIIVAAGPGGGPHVRIFNRGGKLLNSGFYAYAAGFKGGVHVAVGDLDGDGRDEIVTGPGAGGGPQVRVWTSAGRAKASFFAYDEKNRNGVDVALGDLDGDGRLEIAALSTELFKLGR
ncbi:VCBS repeat-containing protein [Candidatus Uhrbacteria bacterium]|nr:VCBS repeat-containing protein [Candidatus Uhrbacteria bacterium]